MKYLPNLNTESGNHQLKKFILVSLFIFVIFYELKTNVPSRLDLRFISGLIFWIIIIWIILRPNRKKEITITDTSLTMGSKKVSLSDIDSIFIPPGENNPSLFFYKNRNGKEVHLGHFHLIGFDRETVYRIIAELKNKKPLIQIKDEFFE